MCQVDVELMFMPISLGFLARSVALVKTGEVKIQLGGRWVHVGRRAGCR